MKHDRAHYLSGVADLWSVIQPELLDAANDAAEAMRHFALDLDDYTGPSMELSMREKFLAGELEHGRDWLRMSRDDLRREIRNELRDLVIYHAMIRARWVDIDPPADFICHVDPGDEQD